VGVLIAASRLADLYEFRALDLHPLSGDRAGFHARRLTGQVRLIVRVEDQRTVTVWEVTDYHD
jgi:plasmid maintenance system killer protein